MTTTGTGGAAQAPGGAEADSDGVQGQEETERASERVYVVGARLSFGEILALTFKFGVAAALVGALLAAVGFVGTAFLAGIMDGLTGRP